MHTVQQRSLLIADELGLVREGIAGLCESSGMFSAVYQSDDGLAALQTLKSMRPDLALVDFNIPQLFCLELMRRMKEEAIGTRVVVMAAKGDRKMAVEVLRAGASGFLPKTGPGSRLLEVLQRVASGSLYVPPELELERVYLQPRRSDIADPIESLSSREYQVFQLLVDGVRAKEIAFRLNLSPKTVDTYRASLMRKLDIYDVAGLVKYAIHRDLTAR
jgi:DNA-binding NarL/FixJ family response regulator